MPRFLRAKECSTELIEDYAGPDVYADLEVSIMVVTNNQYCRCSGPHIFPAYSYLTIDDFGGDNRYIVEDIGVYNDNRAILDYRDLLKPIICAACSKDCWIIESIELRIKPESPRDLLKKSLLNK